MIVVVLVALLSARTARAVPIPTTESQTFLNVGSVLPAHRLLFGGEFRNADGYADPVMVTNTQVCVFLSSDRGNAYTEHCATLTSGTIGAVTLLDANNDGILDVVYEANDLDIYLVLGDPATGLFQPFNETATTPAATRPSPLPGMWVFDAAADYDFDWDGDGRGDFAVEKDGTVVVMLAQPNGTFVKAFDFALCSAGALDINIAPPFPGANTWNVYSIFQGTVCRHDLGVGALIASGPISTRAEPPFFAYDINGDNITDIVAGDPGFTFGLYVLYAFGTPSSFVADEFSNTFWGYVNLGYIGDYTNNSLPDFAVTGANNLWYVTGEATPSVFSSSEGVSNNIGYVDRYGQGLFRKTQTPAFWSYRLGNAEDLFINYWPVPTVCPELTPPTHGTVSATTGLVDDLVTITCSAGYQHAPGVTATIDCLDTREWNVTYNAATVCEPVPCPRPAIANGTITGPSDPRYLDGITVGCDNGYDLALSSSYTCSASGTWNPVLPVDPVFCTPNPTYCAVISAPSNAVMGGGTCSEAIGSTCEFTCNTGYSRVGAPATTCVDDGPTAGTWSNPLPTCVLIDPWCPPLNNTAVAAVAPSCAHTIGATCELTCNGGYVPTAGSVSRTCQESREWAGTPIECGLKADYCPLLAPPDDGVVDGASCGRLLHDECDFSCNAGYALQGPATRTCTALTTEAGFWSTAQPTCVVIDPFCPVLSPPAKATFSGACAATIASSCTATCNTGYTVAGGSATRTCGASASWSGDPLVCTATPNFCPALDAPPNAVIQGPSCARTESSVCTTVCDPGYEIATGDASRTCAASGSLGVWTGTAATCASQPDYCPDLVALGLGNGTVGGVGCGREVDNTCEYACNEGYILTGVVSRTCDASGQWTGAAPTCIFDTAVCDPLAPIPNAVIDGGTCAPVIDGVCDQTCNTGYELTGGSASRTCQLAGDWTGTPASCTRVSGFCPDLTASPPADGTVGGGSCDTTLDSVCTYACNTGYLLSGAASRTCGLDQTWSSAAPTCTKDLEFCPPIDLITDGTVSGATCGRALGDACTQSCNLGYQLSSGAVTRTCTTGAVWSDAAGVCELDLGFCSVLAPPAHATMLPCNTTHASECAFQCNHGYQPVGGTAMRTCGATRAWSGTPLDCAPVNCGPITTVVPGGDLACTGNLFNDTCSWSCTPPLLLFGTRTRTCLASGAWSGDDLTVCSQSDVGQSTVNASLPHAVTADASVLPMGWSIDVQVRSGSGDPVLTGNDRVELRLGGTTVRQLTYTGADGVYTLTGPAYQAYPSTAGSYTYQVYINEVLMTPAQPLTLTVTPGVAAAAYSTVEGEGLAGGQEGSPWEAFIVVSDAFGNRLTDVASVATPGVSMTRSSTTITSVVTTRLASRFRVHFTPSTGGLYALTVSINGLSIEGSPWVIIVLSLCHPGTYAVEPTGPCEICPESSFTNRTNQPECTACAPNTVTDFRGASDAANCTCVPHTYSPVNDGSACLDCPFGATCAGGREEPKSKKGFFPSPNDPYEFLSCPNSRACLGNGECRVGYTGLLCADCESGYYRIGDTCYACNSGQAASIVILLIIMAFAFAGLLIWLNTRDTNMRGVAAFMIGFNSLQLIAVFGQIDLEWPAFATTVFDVLSVFNFNLDLAAPECSFTVGDPYLFKFILTMLLPVIFVGIFAIMMGCGLVYRSVVGKHGHRFEAKFPKFTARPNTMHVSCATQVRYRASVCCTSTRVTKAALWHGTKRAYVHSLVFLFMPLTAMTLRVLDCVQIEDGSFVMMANPSQECYTAYYWSLFGVASIFIALYCIGIPAAISVVLWLGNRRLDPVIFASRYAFLVSRFDGDHFWYEVAIMVRKLAVVVASTVFRTPLVKATVAAFALFVSFGHLSFVGPYERYFHNRLATSTVATAVMVLFGGIITYSDTIRDLFIIAGLVLCLLLILGGVAFDMVMLMRRDREELEAWEKEDGFFADGEDDFDLSSATLSARHSMEMGVQMETIDSPESTGPQSVVVHHSVHSSHSSGGAAVISDGFSGTTLSGGGYSLPVTSPITSPVTSPVNSYQAVSLPPPPSMPASAPPSMPASMSASDLLSGVDDALVAQ